MHKLTLLSFVIVTLTSLALAKPSAQTVEEKNVICYFASWTVYRNGRGAFGVGEINPELCTHINFAFVGLNPDGSVHNLDPWASTDPSGYDSVRNLVRLKTKYPHLKILLSMGGWNEGSAVYSAVAANPNTRNNLAQNVLLFLRDWGFDGFDLDWEYPAKRGGNTQIDRDDFTELLRVLYSTLKPHGYILSAAVAGYADVIDDSYDVPAISELLDMINVMTYDYHQNFELEVGHASPLYASPLDIRHQKPTLNVKSGIDAWLSAGAPPQKINLGIITYGRTFTLSDPKNTSLYAPTSGPGQVGPYTSQNGILGYNEICEYHLRTNYYWDDEQKVPHRVWSNQWVGFEDKRSIQFKTQFVLDNKLGGVMVWSLDTDDFRNVCKNGPFPLLTAINDGLQRT